MKKLNLNITAASCSFIRSILDDKADIFIDSLRNAYEGRRIEWLAEPTDFLTDEEIKKQAAKIKKESLRLKTLLIDADHLTDVAIDFGGYPQQPFWDKECLLNLLSDLVERIDSSPALLSQKGRPPSDDNRTLIRIFIFCWRDATGELPKKYAQNDFHSLVDHLYAEAGINHKFSWSSIENEIRNFSDIKKK